MDRGTYSNAVVGWGSTSKHSGQDMVYQASHLNGQDKLGINYYVEVLYHRIEYTDNDYSYVLANYSAIHAQKG